MSVFDKVTHATIKDCFIDDFGNLCFVVPKAQLGKAIGKNGSNVKQISQKLNKRIRIYEFNQNISFFIQNLLYPIKPAEITIKDEIVYIKHPDISTKSIIIGKNAKNLRNMEKIIGRYFSDIKEIKVI